MLPAAQHEDVFAHDVPGIWLVRDGKVTEFQVGGFVPADVVVESDSLFEPVCCAAIQVE